MCIEKRWFLCCCLGNPEYGGEIPENIKEKLNNVIHIFNNNMAFCALKKDGSSVVAWGDPDDGGKITNDIYLIFI